MAQTRIRLGPQVQQSSTPGSIIVSNTSNEAQYTAPSTGADHLWGYDDSATATVPMSIGAGLTITGTTLSVTGGSSGYSEIQEEGTPVGASNTKINFVGSGLTAADAGSGVTSVTVATFLNTLATAGAVNLASHVTGDLPYANLAQGSALSVLGVAGNSTADNASIAAAADHQVLRRNSTTLGFGAINLGSTNAVSGVLLATNGGTGNSSYAVGDILSAGTTTTLSKIAAVASGSVLKSAGVSTLPVWGTLASTDLTDSANIAMLNQNETVSGTWTFSNNITMNGTPSASTDVITVGYLQTQLANQRRTSVRVATTAAGTLATSFEDGDTIDSITIATGDRILIKDQAAQAENGIYVVQATGAPVRAIDMDTAAEVDGTLVIVEDGTTNAGTIWYTISEVTTLNTDAIVWTRLDKATDITAGTGLSFSGLTLNVGTASTSRIVVNANDIDLATTAVTPASYGSATQVATFTVDAYGRLTAAGNTTIAIPSTAISDFTEAVQDVVGNASFLLDGGATTITYNDGANTLTIASENLYTDDGTIPAATTRTVSFGDTASELLFQNAATGILLQIADDNVYIMDGVVSIDADAITIATTGGSIDLSPTGLVITTSNDDSDDYTFTDSRTTTRGLEYAADYSADFTNRTLVDKEYVDDAVTAATVTVTQAYLTGSTLTTVDLDTGTAVTDVDGANISFTLPTDLKKFFVYRNGVRLSMSGNPSPARDYTVNAGTNEITFVTALTAGESIVFEKLG